MNDIEKVAIRGLGASGEGVGSIVDGVDRLTIFVDGALPEEVVEARIFQRKKTYGKADLLKIIKPSKDRVEPICPLFGRCGGCQIMHLSYEGQLLIKQQRVMDALKRIAKIDVEVAPCVPSPRPFHYRNKIQMPVRRLRAGALQIGLFAKNSHDLVDVEKCYIHGELGEAVYEKVRELLLKAKLGDELQYLMIKSAVFTAEVLVVLVTRGEPSRELRKIARKIMENSSQVKGVIHNLQPEVSNVILGRRYETLAGASMIFEKLLGLIFKVSPASFFQVNPFQAEALYSKAIEFASLTGKETLLDAFCGVGTLSLLAAKAAKEIIGVEFVRDAILDAEQNALLNGITNTTFVCEDVAIFLKNKAAFDVVFLNPPRQGCDLAVIQSIGKLSPKIVVYISCDPATLARDLALLLDFGYRVENVAPFDMFPETAHVETVVRLLKE